MYEKLSSFYSLPKNQNLDWFKLKAFVDEKYKPKQKISLSWNRKSMGKGENAGYQRYLLFPHCFQIVSSSKSIKLGIVW